MDPIKMNEPPVLNVPSDSQFLSQVLLTGFATYQNQKWIALPREKVCLPDGRQSILFELQRPDSRRRPSFNEILRDQNALAILNSCFFLGLAVLGQGSLNGWSGSWGLSVLSLLGVLFFQIAARSYHDVRDYLSLLDLSTLKTQTTGVLTHGWVTPQSLNRFGDLSLLVGAILGLPSVIREPKLIGVGACAVLVVLSLKFQSLLPISRGFWSFVIFLIRGPFFALGLSQATFGMWDGSIFSLGIFSGFLSWAQSHLKILHSVDRLSASSLGPTRGYRASRTFYLLLYLFSGAGLLTGTLLFRLPLLTLLPTLLFSLPLSRHLTSVISASGPLSPLHVDFKRQATLLNFYIIFFCTLMILISNLIHI